MIVISDLQMTNNKSKEDEAKLTESLENCNMISANLQSYYYTYHISPNTIPRGSHYFVINSFATNLVGPE